MKPPVFAFTIYIYDVKQNLASNRSRTPRLPKTSGWAKKTSPVQPFKSNPPIFEDLWKLGRTRPKVSPVKPTVSSASGYPAPKAGNVTKRAELVCHGKLPILKTFGVAAPLLSAVKLRSSIMFDQSLGGIGDTFVWQHFVRSGADRQTCIPEV